MSAAEEALMRSGVAGKYEQPQGRSLTNVELTDMYHTEVKTQIDRFIKDWWKDGRDVQGDDLMDDLGAQVSEIAPGAEFDPDKMIVTLPNGTQMDIDPEEGATIRVLGGARGVPQPTKGKGVEMISSMDTEGNVTEYEPSGAAPSRKDAWDAWNAPYEGPNGLKASDEDAALSLLKTIMPDEYGDAGIEAVRTPAMSEALDEIYEMNSGTGISRKNIQQVVDILTKAAKKK
jgi:hypothetical protein